jgi:hypothetical protein
MRSIVTFSLVVDPECCHYQWCGCYEPTFDSAVIDGLIAFLPSSCVNLELDTGGTESDGDGEETHICTTIQTLLPQLRHLRLRLRSLCAAAFCQHSTCDVPQTLTPVAAPHLASMTISFVIFPRKSEAIPVTCFRSFARPFYRKQFEMGQSDIEHFDIKQLEVAFSGRYHKLAQVLHGIYRTCFPLLKALNIFDAANTGFNDILTDHLCPFGIIDNILHYDILKSVTHALPLHVMCSAGNGGRWFNNYVVRNHKDEIILGSHAKIERYLEQSWCNVAEEGACPVIGLRFPITFKASVVAENPGIQWYEPTVGGLCNEEAYRNYVAEKDIENLEEYRFNFADYEHHDYQDEAVDARHAKTVKGFVWDIQCVREN